MGDDEGFELIKPFLCYKGFKLYSDIWNDQPPVSTVVLTYGFKMFGPTVLTARLIASAFGLMMVVSFHELVRRRSGEWSALIASVLLVTAPSVLLLSVSVMLEGMMMALALLSALIVFIWGKRRLWFLLGVSGVFAGTALQTKMTTAVVLPAIFLELLLLTQAKPLKSWIKASVLPATVWSICLLVTFLLIGMTWGRGSLQTSWKSHTAASHVPGLDQPLDHKFEPKLLREHSEAVLAALVAIVLAWRQGRLREIAFPLTLLATASIIHAIHRPWWNYYYLHFAIPISWLAGWTISEFICFVLKLNQKNRFTLSSAPTWGLLALCVLVALPFAWAERRLEGIVKDLRTRPTIASNSIVRKMKEYQSRTEWVYSESGIYPFHAQLQAIPELAIIMPKRFWSGQITTTEIIETCQRKQPEMIVSPITVIHGDWRRFLNSHYTQIASDKKNLLFVANALASPNAGTDSLTPPP